MSASVQPHRRQPTRLPVPRILQARTLEWVAISFSNAWKWKVEVKSLSRVRLPATPQTAAHQAPPSMGFSRQQCWSGVPLPSPMEHLDKPLKTLSPSQVCISSLINTLILQPAITGLISALFKKYEKLVKCLTQTILCLNSTLLTYNLITQSRVD